ncbi:NAD(P)H-binding protein [Spirosoma utsteinense]|uniref:NmrA-like domain-containing protein n=1 Tax=Spirosoma utsteinense TaxID=2585773 RepID=A0ABR6W3D4_9BACT|nr:NAD(P)H-binding protein [Spirosoma utsteinense]MBC3789055.1 putative protein YbjT (DUF2867 family) [Spirosoma utsteinense]MBC3791108.1 putative protein YbjT (DUF2867 family) [Spirosoma utsteinense]
MKIIVTGSVGNISKPLARELVQKGHTVTVVSSRTDRQREIEALGAKAAIGSLEDVDFLTRLFTSADAVYTMVPPGNYLDPTLDLRAYYNRIAHHYAQAIEQSGVKRIVHLSSVGAHLSEHTGNILCHYDVEQILNQLSDVAITFMRPTSFYYNLYGYAGMIKTVGYIAANYGADDVVPWVSPNDIAAAVADELVTPLAGRKIRYVASDELSCNEVARILGKAIGKPDLPWIIISDEQMQSGLESAGLSPLISKSLVEMYASQHTGDLSADYEQNRPAVMGKVKIVDFASEFAAAYSQN